MKKIISTMLLVTSCYVIFAQEKKSHWSLSSDNSFAYFAGNVNKFDAITINEIARKDSAYEFALNYQFLYGEQANTKYLLEHMASAYYDYRPYMKLSPWVNTTFLHNIYKGFVMRFNAASGIKYRFIYTPTQDWSLSVGLLYDHSNFTPPTEAGVPQRNTENLFRLSVRPKIKIKFSETAELKHITFYQPELKDFNNFITWSQTEFSVKIIKHVSISTLYYYFYNSRPAYETISKTDQRVMFGVNVAF